MIITRFDPCFYRSLLSSMPPTLVLSVVDQSPVRQGETAADALRETIELAVATEALGYQRYWLAEHHSLPNFAGTSPEILIGQVASRTKSIRVGSGGVMLSHYSSFKVAENFRMLASLYPRADRPRDWAGPRQRSSYCGSVVLSLPTEGHIPLSPASVGPLGPSPRQPGTGPRVLATCKPLPAVP